jgi:molybdate transport system substrate-binding protein
MATVRILSAGAAQAVMEQVIAAFKADTGNDVIAEFSAVGAMKARVVKGEPVDVIVLTRALIDELVASGYVVPDSVHDLGKVGTGVAVRAGAPMPEVNDEAALRASILAASSLACPDPAVATAGKVVMRMLEGLGIAGDMKERMRYFPNGYAAMGWLAKSGGSLELGMTQVSEILANNGVTYVGPFPEKYQMKAVYTVARATQAGEPALAADLIGRLVAPEFRAQLKAAGYEV